MEVYPLNPKSAQAYRDRKAPSGVKDDGLDAWNFADSLPRRRSRSEATAPGGIQTTFDSALAITQDFGVMIRCASVNQTCFGPHED